MIVPPPIYTRTDTLLPCTALFRSKPRVTALGCDVLSGGLTGGSVDGGDVFNKIYTPGGFPSLDGLGGDRNVCINGNPGGGACQGGGNAGPTTGNFITGTITLNFSSDLASDRKSTRLNSSH